MPGARSVHDGRPPSQGGCAVKLVSIKVLVLGAAPGGRSSTNPEGPPAPASGGRRDQLRGLLRERGGEEQRLSRPRADDARDSAVVVYATLVVSTLRAVAPVGLISFRALRDARR